MKSYKYYSVKCVALASLMVGFAFAETVTPIYQIGDSQGALSAAPFIQVSLTQEIYHYPLLRPDLQNLRVLDAALNPLPYRIVRVLPAPQQPEQPVVRENLLFFPIAVDASAASLRKLHSEKLQVEGGTVQLTTSDSILNNKTPEFYLLDISKLGHDITGLTIDWDAETGSQYLELELEATEDLQNWVSLGRSTLVQIVQLQQSLKKNTIATAIAKDKYQFLRLRIIRGADNLQLGRVTAEQKPGIAAVAPQIGESWSLAGELAKLQTEVGAGKAHGKSLAVAAWEFTRSESTPAETLAIDFGQQTYGSSGKVFSRAADSANWELQYQGIFFNAQIGSQWQGSDPVNVHSNSDKYWRIELDDSARDKLSPRLVFSWQPMALQIIANNKPPFSLAVSDSNNGHHGKQVFDQLAALSTPVWQSATLIALDVKPEFSGLLPSPSLKKIDWSQYLFWAALLLAVVVLLVFSLKLFRQINVDTGKT